METNFAEWLNNEMKTRNMNQVELAQKSGVTTAQISRILSGQRGAEGKTLVAIAKGLRLPAEQVFRKAGLLPPATKSDEETERIIYETADLTEQEKQEVLAFINMKRNLRKRK
jgi:transcriptional regulator with XRE-family HTH domain